jgi:C-terminal processing protease CtpA/Prc
MTFQVSARRYRLADGRRFEGAGIPPHVVVTLRLADYRSTADPTLARGLDVARALLDSAGRRAIAKVE